MNGSEGFLDTNVFVHSLTRDAFAAECRHFLRAVEDGRIRVRLEPAVLHELSYVLPRYLRGLTRDQVAQHLLSLVELEGVVADKDVLTDTVERWQRTAGLAFVDAYLAALAARDSLSVYTKNVRDLRAQGVVVPEPLPG